MSAATKLKRRSARAGVVGALTLLAIAGASAPASAQFFGGFWGGRPAPFADEALPPRAIARILHEQGYRLTTYPARRGNRIVAFGMDGRGQVQRFVLDAYEGDIIRANPVGGQVPGYGRDAYAYGAPVSPEEPRAVPAPKAKPKSRTAARTPAPLPHAAPASPAPPPSEATTAPAPPTPAAPPPVEAAKPPVASPAPVAVTPPVSEPAAAPPSVPPPAPVAVTPPTAPPVAVPPVAAAPSEATTAPALPTRPAPDAQPGDVGPKIVPVKPSEARAPDRAPDSWDTEAEPAKPATAPSPPVERYKE